MIIRAIGAAIVIASLSSAGIARQPDAFDACAQKSDPAARLACFDGEVASRRGSAAAPSSSAPTERPAVSTPTPAAAPAPAANPDIGLDAHQARRERRARGETEPSPQPAIAARVVRVIPRRPLIAAFELDNGQIWEQTDAMSFSTRPEEAVTIRRGVLGAFFLKNADGAVVRVHRVK